MADRFADALHQANPKLRLVHFPDSNPKGRGLCVSDVVSTQLQRGSLVLEQLPLVCALRAEQLKLRCNAPHCWKLLPAVERGVKRQRCSQCKAAWYCSKRCFAAAWKHGGHREECARLVAQPALVERLRDAPSIRMAVRLWDLAHKTNNNKKKTQQSLDVEGILQQLQHGREDASPEQLYEVGQMGVLVKLVLGADGAGDVVQHATRSLLILKRNAISVADPELRPIGIALYPFVAMLNHSCEPSAVVTFRGSMAQVRTLRKLRVGEEVTISYIDDTQCLAARRAELQRSYGFECLCARCTDPDPMRDLRVSGFLCQSEECEGLLDPATGQCVLCEQKVDVEPLKAQLKSGELLGLVPLSHERMVQLVNEQLTRCIDEQRWEDAEEPARLSLRVYQAAFENRVHPLVGLQYALAGKVLLYLQHPRDALKCLERAQRVLSITHGPDHPLVVKVVADDIAEARLSLQQ